MSTTAFRPVASEPSYPITAVHAQKGNGVQRHIRCDVVFGSPSLGCRGTGVCKITAYQPAEPQVQLRDCKKAGAFIGAVHGGYGLSLMLPKGFLCANIMRFHLSKPFFEINEPCTLPSSFQAALGLKIDQIKPGKYPIQDMEMFLRIDFS
jgi:hypothetical protein